MGDRDAARTRLAALAPLARLATPTRARQLAQRLVDAGAVPRTAAQDALHTAIAALHGVEFLATWNFRHIANATTRRRIESVCREVGFDSPILCTPEELVAEEDAGDER